MTKIKDFNITNITESGGGIVSQSYLKPENFLDTIPAHTYQVKIQVYHASEKKWKTTSEIAAAFNLTSAVVISNNNFRDFILKNTENTQSSAKVRLNLYDATLKANYYSTEKNITIKPKLDDVSISNKGIFIDSNNDKYTDEYIEDFNSKYCISRDISIKGMKNNQDINSKISYTLKIGGNFLNP